jgi:hypothetical protein
MTGVTLPDTTHVPRAVDVLGKVSASVLVCVVLYILGDKWLDGGTRTILIHLGVIMCIWLLMLGTFHVGWMVLATMAAYAETPPWMSYPISIASPVIVSTKLIPIVAALLTPAAGNGLAVGLIVAGGLFVILLATMLLAGLLNMVASLVHCFFK